MTIQSVGAPTMWPDVWGPSNYGGTAVPTGSTQWTGQDYLDGLLNAYLTSETIKAQTDIINANARQQQTMAALERTSNPGAVPYDPRTGTVRQVGGLNINDPLLWVLGLGVLFLVMK